MMRTSQYLIPTLKETPAEAEVISHKLMLRSGMIRKVASGLYNWLPIGIRVLRKVENIIREEMNRVGAIEFSMPIVQPINLWKESGRFKEYGNELIHFFDRNRQSFILGPTHEEIITNLIRNEIISYKQLPLNLYQIQTKFRDEIRPRFGIIRSREFIMKDAYSFHIDQYSLQQTYDLMYKVYSTIFTRIGLNFKIVKADTGSIGGNISHEFHVLADSGEDNIIFSTNSDYASNIELAEAICSDKSRDIPSEDIRLIDTLNIKNIKDLANKYQLSLNKIVKTLIVRATNGNDYKFIALLIRGDHELNIIKAEKHPLILSPFKFATKDEIRIILNLDPDSLGPINLPIPIIIDRSVAIMSDFIAGANINNKYYFGINWERDLPLVEIYDLRKVVKGDLSPDLKGTIQVKRGIEVGHIFQLGTKYSEIMKAKVQDKNGYNQTVMMGCYGIGVTRIIAAAIEQSHDNNGIIWFDAIAPFNVAILPINIHKSCYVKEIAEKLYFDFKLNGIDVIFYDHKERPGVMFNDIDLIGIPHIIIISDFILNKNKVEYKYRKNNIKEYICLSEIVNYLKIKLNLFINS